MWVLYMNLGKAHLKINSVMSINSVIVNLKTLTVTI